MKHRSKRTKRNKSTYDLYNGTKWDNYRLGDVLHGHFICYECDQTFCLDDVKSPDLSDLKGFHVKDLKLIVEGYCKECYQS